MRRALASLACLAALLLALGGAWSAARLRVPADRAGESRTFEVAPGETLAGIAGRLDAAGLLPRPWPLGTRVLVGFARLRGVDRDVKSGEYELSARMTPVEILEMLVDGNVKTHAVTLPEGLRLDEIAARLEQSGIVEAGRFLEVARSEAFARALGVEAATLEGYLYPETYRFRRQSPPEEVVRALFAEFERHWTPGEAAQAAQLGLTRHEVLTLASIVEKETGRADERPLIAAVFHNRLRRGMRLQSDPTVIYGLLETKGGFDGNLRRADLERDTAYNTYTRGGLPPGPIASVGRDALRAALHPAKVSYLYFVSRNDGSHAFSRSLEEHGRAVDHYQRRPARPGAS